MANQNTELLNELYKASSMGTSSINKILPKVKNPKLKKDLKAQLDTYHDSCQRLRSQIYQNNSEPQDINAVAKIMADMGITFNTAVDTSPTKIAELMINGTNMGIIAVQKALNSCPNADDNLKKQTQDMLSAEQKYIDILKNYL